MLVVIIGRIVLWGMEGGGIRAGVGGGMEIGWRVVGGEGWVGRAMIAVENLGLRRVGEVGVDGGGAEGTCTYLGIVVRLGMRKVC